MNDRRNPPSAPQASVTYYVTPPCAGDASQCHVLSDTGLGGAR